jgi:hypothetical protein
MKQIREKVLEIVEIAKACPENLQAICFETLLKYYLEKQSPGSAKGRKDVTAETAKSDEPEAESSGREKQTQPGAKQEDIRESDLHLKARKFMEKEGVTIAQINNLFYKEGEKILPLFDNLKTTRMAESQVRVTLLQCLINALSTGDFQAQLETVRTECTERKCYDGTNFMSNFRNNRGLFDSENIDRKTKSLRLSEAGKKELAKIIKELQ